MKLLKIGAFVGGFVFGFTSSISLVTFVLVVLISLVAVWRWFVYRGIIGGTHE